MAKLIGLSGKELSEYLLLQGYNNDCHIDHIIPLSRFNLIDSEHQMIACHYLNLQPLHKFENISKHDNLPLDWKNKIYQICEVRNINPESIIKHIRAGIK